MRHFLVERFETYTSGLSVTPGPDGRQIVRRGDFAFQWLCSIGSSNTPCHFAVFGRESVFQSVHQEFLESGNIRFVFERSAMQELRGSEALNGSVNFRGAQTEVVRNNRHRRTPVWVTHELQRNYYVLGLQVHGFILHSRIAN